MEEDVLEQVVMGKRPDLQKFQGYHPVGSPEHTVLGLRWALGTTARARARDAFLGALGPAAVRFCVLTLLHTVWCDARALKPAESRHEEATTLHSRDLSEGVQGLSVRV